MTVLLTVNLRLQKFSKIISYSATDQSAIPLAILGSLFAAVGNLLHPITPRDDPEGVTQVIAKAKNGRSST
jgi:hypothetical protein